jgi:hypothetical protein
LFIGVLDILARGAWLGFSPGKHLGSTALLFAFTGLLRFDGQKSVRR